MSQCSKPRYLTKSRFKLALECPTKLFYTGKAQYPDQKQEDAFLQALADGGFQVGELAKYLFPGGIEIKSRSHDEQVAETLGLLEQEEVTLFEAAICHDNLFARVDVLRKVGAKVELIEVKAKSFDSTVGSDFRGARGGIDSNMKPYLQDVAFQRYVLLKAFPHLQVSSFLLLADKAKACTVDGLNQRFKVRRADGRPVVAVAPGTDASALGAPILTMVNVDDIVEEILTTPIKVPGGTGKLTELVVSWSESYKADKRIPPTLGAQCARCEFHSEQTDEGVRSGLHDCWREAGGLTDDDMAKGTVLDLWNFRDKQMLIDQGVLLLSDVPVEALGDQHGPDGLTRGRRQAMQVTGRWPGRPDFYLDSALIEREIGKWSFPLHFIDFETARVAIPFFAGQRPYANIAFQFSHHVVDADGCVEHRSQFLATVPGRRPNYDFVRALQVELGPVGTVLMWSPHEKTTLNAILEELEQDPAPPTDAEALAAFIRSLTTKAEGKFTPREPGRTLIDLCRLAEKAFFHPATKGSNSIKKVLPAVMQSSEHLKQRYSQPIYGAKGGIPSLNFTDQVWWQETDGAVTDPYRLLPPVFSDLPRGEIETLEGNEDWEIAQGGAATTAFAKLQFETIGRQEKRSIEDALLRYCELDTLAMVMVYEAWLELASQ